MDAPTALTCIGKTYGPREKANTDQERAALAWTEAVTNIQQGHAPDEVFETTRQHFSEKELTDLTLAIATINAWNRLVISVRAVPGKYKPGDALSGKMAA
jgi:alkylhydroperoxidase family enzyme